MSASLVTSDVPSRFVVGIDLGTTNSAVGLVDTAEAEWRVQNFLVPQLVAPGVVEARETLPSFHYQRAQGEFAPNALRLPWSTDDPDSVVGCFARDHGALVPGRLIASAKSWLCHAGVDRLADLLPWHGAADVDRMSPVEASARYLAHIRGAWNARFPADPLESQDVVLTLPASFDEVARELTVKAAARAGLPRVMLIEEPQAAFYAWLNSHAEVWEQRVAPGQMILICDVGGGTSDFTLIRAAAGAGGKVRFDRVAVGDHLILGGDNLDLALAHHVEQKLGGHLEPRQWAVLVQTCRQAKETLLGNRAPQRLVMNLPGSGSRVIGGSRQVEVSREEVEQVLVEGFFPRVALDEKPRARQSGFQEFGLPYAPDAAITRYLAAFLTAHRFVTLEGEATPAEAAATAGGHDPARPDLVLFNGGVFASELLRQRLLQVLGSWFPGHGGATWQPVVLANDRLDLAVARGAAYYGMVRRGVGVRISARLARSYFIGVETSSTQPTAVCLVPAGIEEGQEVDLRERQFQLLIRQPVEFPLYASSTRLTGRPGDLVEVDPEQMTPLPPIRTVLQSGKKASEAQTVAVRLHGRLTEIGTLDLWFSELDGPRTWRLQFDVRAATRTDLAGHQGLAERQGIVEEPLVAACRTVIEQTFDAAKTAADKSAAKPETLVKRLTEVAGMPRHEWPPSLLRAMWEALTDVETGRKRSPTHEARWLNLLGFALRPGYGMAMDDWRVAQTWRILQGRLVHGHPMCRAEWWVLWRRIAGGLEAGQQRALAEPLIGEIRAAARALAKGRGSELRPSSHETAELWRVLGAFELLGTGAKIELGQFIVDLAPREKVASVRGAMLWTLGRLGARVPLYGPLNAVVPSDAVEAWTERVMSLRDPPDTAPLAIMQMARRTSDRYRDLPEKLRRSILTWLEGQQAPPHFLQLVREGGELEAEEQGLVFGESLPQGLRAV